MPPSKDNILVAHCKERGRRSEEEKACGVQRSPDSILFQVGTAPFTAGMLCRTSWFCHRAVAVLQSCDFTSFAMMQLQGVPESGML